MTAKLGKQKCPLCGSNTDHRMAFVFNGKFPPRFSGRKINKIEHRISQINALISQIERLLV